MRISMSSRLWTDIHQQLDDGSECAVFLFVNEDPVVEGVLQVVDVRYLDPEHDYEDRSGEHLALADHVLGQVIKQAHDLGAGIVEVHGHYTEGGSTCMSPYDIRGLRELTPQVLWRLPDRAYVALVVGKESFDGLVWTAVGAPESLEGLIIDGARHSATGLSLALLDEGGD